VDRTCFVRISNSYISKTTFNICGNNNRIECKGGKIHKCHIYIDGNNNDITIESDINLFNTTIRIRANKNIIKIGQGTSVNGATLISMGEDNSLIIGKDCMFADEIDIWNTDSHPFFSIENGLQLNNSRPIIIGNHVWIGRQVSILKGVCIGDGAIIGMKTLVTKNIPKNTLNVGVPSKVIKENVYWIRKDTEV
jgi:acetyltransferase-like isoleucine patch superfamily enzyme